MTICVKFVNTYYSGIQINIAKNSFTPPTRVCIKWINEIIAVVLVLVEHLYIQD